MKYKFAERHLILRSGRPPVNGQLQNRMIPTTLPLVANSSAPSMKEVNAGTGKPDHAQSGNFAPG